MKNGTDSLQVRLSSQRRISRTDPIQNSSVSILTEAASATGEAWQTSTTYSCCGIESTTDKYGITTYHAYDSLNRRIKTNRIGVTTETVHNGLTIETHRYAETVSGSLSSTLVDNDDNLIGKSSRNLAGTSMTSSSPDPTKSQWQDANVPEPGKLVDTTTTITYQPAAGLSKRVVVTTPDNFSQTTDYYLDGRTHKTTGDLSPAMENAYSVNATGELTTRGYIVGTGHNEVTGTQTDHAGRVLLSGHLSSLGSSVFQSSVSTEYNGLGQMVKSVDPDGVTTLMLYNTRGERTITATDLNDNDAIDYGTDSVSFSEMVPALDGNSNPAWQTVSKVWQDGQTSAAGGTVVSTSLRSPDGLSATNQSVGVANPTTRVTTLAGGGDWTEKTTAPDGTDTLQTYTAGLLASSEVRDSSDATIESVSYGYDNFNRQTTSTHSRTGTTTTAYLSATADVVASVTDSNNRVTAFTYDVRGRRTEVDAPDTLIAGGTSTNITITAYNPDSTVQETTGAQTYRVTYEYDYADRRKTMTTYGTTIAETEWFYSPTRGFMTRKEYADDEGTDYTYTAAGRLATRTWARGVVTTYGYDDGGRLVSTDYSDATPDLVFTYDALNRQKTVTRGGVLHASYAYDPADLVLAAERQQIDTLNRTVVRSYDAFLRPTGHTAGTPDGTDPFIVDTVEATATWTRDTAGRLATVTGGPAAGGPANAGFTYGYTYEVNGAGNHQGATAGTLFESAMPFTLDGPRVDTALEYDATRNALLGRTNTYPGGSGTLSDFAYSVNAIGQRDGLTTTGDAFATDLNWAWAYNIRGELVQADDQSTAGNDRAYEFDGIGNRLFSEISSTEISDPAGPNTTAYTPNALNQYTAIGSQSPIHDDDGNVTSGPLPAAPGTTSTLVWDAENRLISATVGTTTTTYTYDHLSRLTSVTTGGTTVRYLYDGWNRIAEYNGTTQIAAYLWGLDLSGTPQGAGGVGGLLAISAIASGSIADTFYPAYDGNGNVSEYVNAAGAEVAHFEYDPFGNLTVDAAMNAASFPYRFSTKPQDEVTGLYYYGYRWYDPVTGRWPSRDPIGERGGFNLYRFTGNSGISKFDLLGLMVIDGVAVTRIGNDIQQGREASTWVDTSATFESRKEGQKCCVRLKSLTWQVFMRYPSNEMLKAAGFVTDVSRLPEFLEKYPTLREWYEGGRGEDGQVIPGEQLRTEASIWEHEMAHVMQYVRFSHAALTSTIQDLKKLEEGKCYASKEKAEGVAERMSGDYPNKFHQALKEKLPPINGFSGSEAEATQAEIDKLRELFDALNRGGIDGAGL
ncbi:RHS repeat-associated core domain-containing protein [Haloferula sp. A504]|uniref:RHS repeat-associated core domain-containing protein n=1 Tax=Haloferula sp. A504 TaxID=3373601 RepID=UPI0031BC78B4|nr:hypothetical protein [Verrucomicrobiaceae bacterium E54]